MAKLTIDVDPSLVRWARESAGLSVPVAAKKIGVNPAKLSLWETAGASQRPTARQLERLADAVKRPVAAFFLPEPPQEAPLPADFRRTPGTTAPGPLSSAARLAIRRARRLQGVFVDLSVDVPARPARLAEHVTVDSDPESVAAEARDHLGVTLDEQAKWAGDSDAALKAWRAGLERLGLLVFQFAMPRDEVSGFSLSDTVPAVVLNKRDPHNRRCFTLFHEWAHLLLDEPGLCFVEEGRTVGGAHRVELFCNAFAGALLVPLPSVASLDVDGRADAPARRRAMEAAVQQGVRRFAVSRYVVLRRLLTAGAITADEYRRTAGEWDAEQAKPRPKAKGGPPPHAKTVSELGRRFVSRVLRAHEHGFVSDVEVADFLSLKLKHLDKVEALVGQG